MLHLPLNQSLLLLLDVVLLLSVVLDDEPMDLLGKLLTHGSLENVKAIREKVIRVLDTLFSCLLDCLLERGHASVYIDLYLTSSKLGSNHWEEYNNDIL